MQVADSKANTKPEREYSRVVQTTSNQCLVCRHSKRDLIDKLLATGVTSLRDIASQFDCGSYQAVQRHKTNHLGKRVSNAVMRRDKAVTKADDAFLDGIERNIRRMGKGVAHGIAALETGQIEPDLAFRMAPAFAAQQLRGLELLGKATGRLTDAQTGRAVSVIVLQAGPAIAGPSQAQLQIEDENTIDVKAIG